MPTFVIRGMDAIRNLAFVTFGLVGIYTAMSEGLPLDLRIGLLTAYIGNGLLGYLAIGAGNLLVVRHKNSSMTRL